MLRFLILVVLSGLIVGALGRLAVPGRDPMGIGMTILVGIGGSLIGGFVGRLLFGPRGTAMILAVGGAALIVLLMRRLARNRAADLPARDDLRPLP